MRLPRLAERLKDQLAVAVAVLLVGAFAFSGVSTYLTVTGHNGDLKRISQQNNQILVLQKEHFAEVKQVKQDTQVVAKYAAALQAEIAMNHTISASYEQAICAAIPGCVLPTPSTGASP